MLQLKFIKTPEKNPPKNDFEWRILFTQQFHCPNYSAQKYPKNTKKIYVTLKIFLYSVSEYMFPENSDGLGNAQSVQKWVNFQSPKPGFCLPDLSLRPRVLYFKKLFKSYFCYFFANIFKCWSIVRNNLRYLKSKIFFVKKGMIV